MSTLLTNNIGDQNTNIPMDAVTYGTAKHAHDYYQLTPTIRSSYNVSSISDLSLGNYRVNFTNNMSSGGQPTVTSSAGSNQCGYGDNNASRVDGFTYNAAGALLDTFSGISTYGDLA